MSRDEDFLHAILSDFADDTLRLAYADWLEERGDPRSEYLRLEAKVAEPGPTNPELLQRLNELRQAIDPRWLWLLDRTRFIPPGSIAAMIRRRPGMYIRSGATSAGLSELAEELLSMSTAEIRSGHGSSIRVCVHGDGSLTVSDNGRGISVSQHPEIRLSILELVMTAGGIGCDSLGMERTAGTHPWGPAIVLALSDWARVEVTCSGIVYTQDYQRGMAAGDVRTVGLVNTQMGTTITFHPDPEIFGHATFEWESLRDRVREVAFLHRELTVTVTDERTGKEECFHHPRGPADFLSYLFGVEKVLHEPIACDRTIDGIRVEMAMQYKATATNERIRCYTNSSYNSQAGTHLTGFRTALTSTLNAYGASENLFPDDMRPTGEDIRQGLTAIISVRVPEPMFDSVSKARLNNPEVEGVVARVVREALVAFQQARPDDARRIIEKAASAAKVRAESRARKPHA